jgi:hypothetical protein
MKRKAEARIRWKAKQGKSRQIEAKHQGPSERETTTGRRAATTAKCVGGWTGIHSPKIWKAEHEAEGARGGLSYKPKNTAGLDTNN